MRECHNKEERLTSAQKRTLEDLKRGVGVYIDKGGRIRHSAQPRMDCYYVVVQIIRPAEEQQT